MMTSSPLGPSSHISVTCNSKHELSSSAKRPRNSRRDASSAPRREHARVGPFKHAKGLTAPDVQVPSHPVGPVKSFKLKQRDSHHTV